MDYFEKAATKQRENPLEEAPGWVSRTNASYDAWKALQSLKRERLNYIKNHSKPSAYRTNKTFQISGSEVANKVGMSKVTLLSTSSYSEAFKQYLAETNAILLRTKEQRVEKSRRSKSRGPIARSKDELVTEVKLQKEEIERLEKMNVTQQIEQIIEILHPDIAEILFLEQKRPTKNIAPFRRKH